MGEVDPMYEDPSGTMQKVAGAISGLVTLIVLIVDWINGNGLDTGAIGVAATALASGVVAIILLSRVKAVAYAPKTVDAIRSGNV